MSNLVSPQDLRALYQSPDLRVVDTRFDLSDPRAGRKAYEAGHLPGAVYLDLDKDLSAKPEVHGGRHPLPDMQAFAERLERAGIGNVSHVVVYDDSAGVFAGRLWWMLRYAGHDKVQLLDGGLSAWQDAGYALTQDVPNNEKGHFTLDLRPELRADKAYVERRLENPDSLLIDARSPERYRGEIEPLDPKAGHIPGAINLPYSENLAGQSYKSPEALRARFADLGLDEVDEVIVYCGSGVSANHNLIALAEAGIENAKLYVGSWSDWSSYDDAPVATEDS